MYHRTCKKNECNDSQVVWFPPGIELLANNFLNAGLKWI